MIAAQAAADAAVAALEESQNRKAELEAQLAALEDTTAETVEGYKKGVEEERKRREAAEKAAREKAAREAREAAEAAKNNNNGGGNGGGGGGGGGSSSGGGGGGSGWARPASGWISSGFGSRNSPGGVGSTNHPGVDIANSSGTPLYAASSGTVTYAGYNGGYGYFIRISHGGGITTAYGHIRAGGLAVRSGQRVSAGQYIAAMGSTGNSTGPHVHFETRVNGTARNPVPFMRDRGVSL
jgi:murein DD-endopeptidase MepM/ murein hydrolase activator NlpD